MSRPPPPFGSVRGEAFSGVLETPCLTFDHSASCACCGFPVSILAAKNLPADLPPPFRSWEGDLHSAVFGEGHCVLRPQDLGRRVPHSTPGEGRQGQIRHLSSPAWPSRLVALQCTSYMSLGGRGWTLRVFDDSECLSYSQGLTRILLLCS